MSRNVRWIAFSAIALVGAVGAVLLANGHRMGETQAKAQVETAAKAAAGAGPCVINDYFSKHRNLAPDWQHLTAQSDGSLIQFNPYTMACVDGTGLRDVWIQIRLARPRQERFEDETTIEDISFNRERYRYRIDCATRRSVVVERRIMGDGPEESARNIMLSAGADADLKPIAEGGVASALLGPVCSTGQY